MLQPQILPPQGSLIERAQAVKFREELTNEQRQPVLASQLEGEPPRMLHNRLLQNVSTDFDDSQYQTIDKAE
jgi:hypothetical protein